LLAPLLADGLESQMTALLVLVFVLAMVMLRSVPPLLEPSMIT
jgi:hypothetical protein